MGSQQSLCITMPLHGHIFLHLWTINSITLLQISWIPLGPRALSFTLLNNPFLLLYHGTPCSAPCQSLNSILFTSSFKMSSSLISFSNYPYPPISWVISYLLIHHFSPGLPNLWTSVLSHRACILWFINQHLSGLQLEFLLPWFFSYLP